MISRVTRVVIGVLAWAMVSSELAGAQLLEYDEIVSNIEGRWAVPFEEDGAEILDCNRLFISIQINNEDDQPVFRSRQINVESGEQHASRSDLRQAKGDSGQFIPAALIRYDNEERTTEDGNLLQWRLYMFSPDAFAWQATHWGWSGWTATRTRCEDDPSTS